MPRFSERKFLLQMDREQAIDLINSSLREGAELRTVVARRLQRRDLLKRPDLIIMCLRGGGKRPVFGNGGSAADAQHLAAEFVGRLSGSAQDCQRLPSRTDSSIPHCSR
jgi:D-sedoheptulose 7-phosphate isomerase